MRVLSLRWVAAFYVTLALGSHAAHAGEEPLGFHPAETADLPTAQLDQQLNAVLDAMIASAEVDPDGKLFFNDVLGDQRFLEFDSGYYWQISAKGREDFPSRSLANRRLGVDPHAAWAEPHHYDSNQFPDEPLRIVQRTVRLPGSEVDWQFVVARSRAVRD
jgi:hypothetical protein